MFEQFPFYHGRYFSYSQYFQFMSLITIVITGLVFTLLRALMICIFKLNPENIEKNSNWAKRTRDSRKIIDTVNEGGVHKFIENNEDEQELKELDVTAEIEVNGEEENMETEKKKGCSHQSTLDLFQKGALTKAKINYGSETKVIHEMTKKLEPKVEMGCGFRCGVILARLFNLLAFLCWGIIPIYLAGFNYWSNWAALLFAMVIFFGYTVKERSFLIPTHGDKTKRDGSVLKWFGTFNELEIENYFCLLLFGLISLLLITFLNTSCVTFDESVIGTHFNYPSLGWEMSYTSSYLRSRQGRRFKCFGFQGPCHFYITLDNDASRSAIANMHMPYNITNLHMELYYDTQIKYFVQGYASQKGAQIKYYTTDYRNFISYRMKGLIPNTDYQVVLKIKQQQLAKGKPLEFNYTVLNYQMPDHLNLPLKFKTLDEGNLNRDHNIVFIGNMGTSKLAEQFWTNNANLQNTDLIAFNGNVVLDSGDFNCLCLWDELLKNMRVYFFRRQRIIPIFMGIGDMDVGYNYMSKHKFFDGYHPSNSGMDIPARTLFPQAHVGPKLIDTYTDYGVMALKLYNNKPGAEKQKKIYIVSVDPGLKVAPSSLRSKEIFRDMVPQDIVVIMWSAALHPGCKWNKWMFDMEAATNEWKTFFDQYADIVVEGGGGFKALKNYRDINNMNDMVTNTIYVGDSYISGNPPDLPFDGEGSACHVEDYVDDDVDKYRFKKIAEKKQPHAWYLTISSNTLQGFAKLNTPKAYDQFNIKI